MKKTLHFILISVWTLSFVGIAFGFVPAFVPFVAIPYIEGRL